MRFVLNVSKHLIWEQKNGGKQLDLNVGEIKAGQLADFVGIDLNNFSMNPLSTNLEQMLPNIVYSLQPDAISTVIIDGEATVEDGELVKVSEAAVLSKVNDTMKYFETIN